MLTFAECLYLQNTCGPESKFSILKNQTLQGGGYCKVKNGEKHTCGAQHWY